MLLQNCSARGKRQVQRICWTWRRRLHRSGRSWGVLNPRYLLSTCFTRCPWLVSPRGCHVACKRGTVCLLDECNPHLLSWVCAWETAVRRLYTNSSNTDIVSASGGRSVNRNSWRGLSKSCGHARPCMDLRVAEELHFKAASIFWKAAGSGEKSGWVRPGQEHAAAGMGRKASMLKTSW